MNFLTTNTNILLHIKYNYKIPISWLWNSNDKKIVRLVLLTLKENFCILKLRDKMEIYKLNKKKWKSD